VIANYTWETDHDTAREPKNIEAVLAMARVCSHSMFQAAQSLAEKRAIKLYQVFPGFARTKLALERYGVIKPSAFVSLKEDLAGQQVEFKPMEEAVMSSAHLKPEANVSESAPAMMPPPPLVPQAKPPESAKRCLTEDIRAALDLYLSGGTRIDDLAAQLRCSNTWAKELMLREAKKLGMLDKMILQTKINKGHWRKQAVPPRPVIHVVHSRTKPKSVAAPTAPRSVEPTRPYAHNLKLFLAGDASIKAMAKGLGVSRWFLADRIKAEALLQGRMKEYEARARMSHSAFMRRGSDVARAVKDQLEPPKFIRTAPALASADSADPDIANQRAYPAKSHPRPDNITFLKWLMCVASGEPHEVTAKRANIDPARFLEVLSTKCLVGGADNLRAFAFDMRREAEKRCKSRHTTGPTRVLVERRKDVNGVEGWHPIDECAAADCVGTPSVESFVEKRYVPKYGYGQYMVTAIRSDGVKLAPLLVNVPDPSGGVPIEAKTPKVDAPAPSAPTSPVPEAPMAPTLAVPQPPLGFRQHVRVAIELAKLAAPGRPLELLLDVAEIVLGVVGSTK